MHVDRRTDITRSLAYSTFGNLDQRSTMLMTHALVLTLALDTTFSFPSFCSFFRSHHYFYQTFGIWHSSASLVAAGWTGIQSTV